MRIVSGIQKKITKSTDQFWINADIDPINVELFNADSVRTDIIRCLSAQNYILSLSKNLFLLSTNTLRPYKNNRELNTYAISNLLTFMTLDKVLTLIKK